MIALAGCAFALAATGAHRLEMWPAGRNIQRTMGLLATSTRAHPNRVKVLFYGQSITNQDWWKAVAADLKRRFPFADLTCENRAIGGFGANLLKKVVQHDVFPSYPDLIILHDYGGEPDYEELIRRIRGGVASEILVQSDHFVAAEPRAQEWHDRHVAWLQNLAEKYQMGFVDVRGSWKQYLDDHHSQPGELLSDGAHLNAAGCGLMASLVNQALVSDPKLPPSPSLVETLPIHWTHGKATVPFDGNRVDLNIGSGSGRIEIRIDGKRPSEFPEMFQITRPSDCFGVDVPAVFQVGRHAPLILEEWTLTVTDIASDVSHWRFSVHGSKTGPDGEGTSDQPFVSNSGRVTIAPDAWYVQTAYQISHQPPPEGFEVRWLVVPEFADEATVSSAGVVTVAKGLRSGRHILELRCAESDPPVKSLTVYKPFLSEPKP